MDTLAVLYYKPFFNMPCHLKFGIVFIMLIEIHFMHFPKNADYGYVEYIAKCNENFALVCRKYSNEFHYVAL